MVQGQNIKRNKRGDSETKMRIRNNPYNERGHCECDKCGEKFRTRSALWTHVHEGKCDRFFSRNSKPKHLNSI